MSLKFSCQPSEHCQQLGNIPHSLKNQSYPELLVLEKLREELTIAISEIIKVRQGEGGDINFVLYSVYQVSIAPG